MYHLPIKVLQKLYHLSTENTLKGSHHQWRFRVLSFHYQWNGLKYRCLNKLNNCINNDNKQLKGVHW